jgi:hypothetical protein
MNISGRISLQFLLMTSLAFYYMKMAFWPFTFIFIFAFSFFLISVLKLKGKSLFNYIPEFIKVFWLPLSLLLVYIIEFFAGMYYSNQIIQKELFLSLILFMFFYLLFWLHRRYGITIKSRDVYLTILASITFVALVNIVYEIFTPLRNSFLPFILHISDGLTVSNDSNFLCLFMFFGILINNTDQALPKVPKHFLVTFFLNILFIANVLLSGSRRGIFALCVLVIIIVITKLYEHVIRKDISIILKKLFVIFAYLFVLTVFGGVAVLILPKQRITEITRRYFELAGINNQQYVDRILWEKEIRVSDKSCLMDQEYFEKNLQYWSSSNAPGTLLSDVQTLFGPSKRVVRNNSNEGGFSLYYMGPKILFLAKHTYQISFKIKFNSGDSTSFRLGWWVDDGNMGFARTLNLRKRFEKIDSSWYKCSAEYTFIENHTDITGYINSMTNGSDFTISDFELKDLSPDPKLPGYLSEIKTVAYPQEYIDSINPSGFKGKSMSMVKSEPVFSDRKLRWKYAAELWENEYSLINKIFGKSFMYSDRFGKKFNNNLPDWPHNPLITVLLYSGFTGFVMYIILILKTCHLYYAYRRRIGIVIMGFAMTFFFSFFSGSNPFDPPIMGFFIVFPFFIHSINKSDNPINNAQNSDNR